MTISLSLRACRIRQVSQMGPGWQHGAVSPFQLTKIFVRGQLYATIHTGGGQFKLSPDTAGAK